MASLSTDLKNFLDMDTECKSSQSRREHEQGKVQEVAGVCVLRMQSSSEWLELLVNRKNKGEVVCF